MSGFDDFWRDLSSGAQAELGRDYAARAFADGAYVVLPDGTSVPIPPILTPVAIERARMRSTCADAHAITRALTKVTRHLMQQPSQAPLRQKLFGAFTPLETEALQTGWQRSEQLATVRVDFLVGPDGQARALEVNSTIPAMQGYSDAIAAAFLRAVAKARNLADAEALVDDNGRNTDDLLASLLAHDTRLGGRPGTKTIAIVARAGDAQEGELLHYVRRFTARGHHALVATPEEVRVQDGRLDVGGVIPDLVYRHIFARRLDPGSDFARACLFPERFHIFNPISSHLEVKGMLGLLSAAAAAPASADAIGLSAEEREVVSRAVPWTRLFVGGAATGPSGEAIDDLPAFVRAHPRSFVLKRSFDYGGKGVFLGDEIEHDPSARARVGAVVGDAGDDPWSALVDFALADRDAWVAQELVAAETAPYLAFDGDRLQRRELYVDLSAFTNVGDAPRPTGGAVRAAPGRIVNILGGGGLSPLVKSDVLERLFTLKTS